MQGSFCFILSSNQTLSILSEQLILQKIDGVKNLQFPTWNICRFGKYFMKWT
jgi:hypothetical protein